MRTHTPTTWFDKRHEQRLSCAASVTATPQNQSLSWNSEIRCLCSYITTCTYPKIIPYCTVVQFTGNRSAGGCWWCLRPHSRSTSEVLNCYSNKSWIKKRLRCRLEHERSKIQTTKIVGPKWDGFATILPTCQSRICTSLLPISSPLLPPMIYLPAMHASKALS